MDKSVRRNGCMPAQIVSPPESEYKFKFYHDETVGTLTYLYWCYNFSVQFPVGDLDRISRLKQAIGEKFTDQRFYRWCQVFCDSLKELSEELADDDWVRLDFLANQDDIAKQEQFKLELKQLLMLKIEDIGLLFGSGDLVFNNDN